MTIWGTVSFPMLIWMDSPCLPQIFRALSPEGKSFSYDAKASGFGRGEGAAFLIIKNLADAVSNGDPIHAVIRNSACNHSGRSEGITMPRRIAQEKLLQQVHEEIGLNPSDTGVVEVKTTIFVRLIISAIADL